MTGTDNNINKPESQPTGQPATQQGDTRAEAARPKDAKAASQASDDERAETSRSERAETSREVSASEQTAAIQADAEQAVEKVQAAEKAQAAEKGSSPMPKTVLENAADANPVESTTQRIRDQKEPPRGKLHSFNYLADVPGGFADCEFVEVLFKNTRKAYYKNSLNLPLEIGEWVAVESQPGHDIGRVSMTGKLVLLQMKKAGVKNPAELKRVFRKARPADMEKFEEAKARENPTMIRSRKIAESLLLNMKIGDVEYQGDGNKAIFYYIADERVDFRQLIKVLAETFKVRIEMKQIGARQEAGRIGGIGPCGRPLCCSSWMTNFVSVATSAARYQDIPLNPQKLAGQCAKLKCCLNFEVDSYMEVVKRMPGKEIRLETADATYYHFKTDIFKREITYSTDKSIAANLVTIDADRAFEIIAQNKAGEKPLRLERDGEEQPKEKKYNDILDQDNLNRFDNKKRKKKSKSKNKAKGENAEAKPDNAQPTPSEEKSEGKPRTENKPRAEGKPQQDGKPNQERKPQSEGKPQQDGKPHQERKPQSEGKPQQDGKPNQERKPHPDGKQSNGKKRFKGNRPDHNGPKSNDHNGQRPNDNSGSKPNNKPE